MLFRSLLILIKIKFFRKILSGTQSLSKGFEQETLVGNELKVLRRCMGAQWLSGRELDSRLKGCVFQPHRRHCFETVLE